MKCSFFNVMDSAKYKPCMCFDVMSHIVVLWLVSHLRRFQKALTWTIWERLEEAGTWCWETWRSRNMSWELRELKKITRNHLSIFGLQNFKLIFVIETWLDFEGLEEVITWRWKVWRSRNLILEGLKKL